MEPRVSKWDTMMAAATYAEANVHDTARRLLEEKRTEKRIFVGRLERWMAAVAFAEANETGIAKAIMREEERPAMRIQPRHELRA